MRLQNLGASLVAVALSLVPAIPCEGRTIAVHCDAHGHSIKRALRHAQPFDVIQIHGTCREKVRITTEHLTLDGLGTAVVEGDGAAFEVFNPLIGVDGARGVVIRGLRIQNGPGEGILAENGAAVSLMNLVLHGNTVGLAVAASSTVELTDATIEQNAAGVAVLTESSLVLKGAIVSRNNDEHGFDVTGNSTLEIRGAQIQATNNGRHGITLDGWRSCFSAFRSLREARSRRRATAATASCSATRRSACSALPPPTQ